jgi:hypothetical protein
LWSLWRISIDTVTDALWIGDVGQDRWEEINVSPAEKAGLNYGWHCYEGNAPFNNSGCSSAGNYYPQVNAYTYQFSIGCSVTGGFEYCGQKYPSLYGKYNYFDFRTEIFWSITTQADGTFLNQQIGDAEEMEFAAFGNDNSGELNVAGLGNGIVYQVQDLTSSTDGAGAPGA